MMSQATNLQIVARKLGLLVILTCLASSGILCAPSQQQQASQQATASSQSAATSSKPLTTTSSPTTSAATGQQISSAASVASGLPSLVNPLRVSENNQRGDMDMDSFDGKNPFADDSLWQIPVHLVRDLSASDGPTDNMAKSASEQSNGAAADEPEDDDQMVSGGPQTVNLQQSSSSSPTVISASTDLKTAAGYHYPTHGHHGYGGDHDSHGYGHGAHHGDHYGGKYFQYASVPYPYAWDFGYRRGNPYHTIERYEHGKGPHFQTKVKWSDKHGGYGVHVWDYNHDDHHSHHYGGHHDSKDYGHHGGHYGHH